MLCSEGYANQITEKTCNIPGEHSPSRFGLLIRFWGLRILEGFRGSTKLLGLENCSVLGLNGSIFSKSNLAALDGVLGVTGLLGNVGARGLATLKGSVVFTFKFKSFNAGFAFLKGVVSTYRHTHIVVIGFT